MKDVTAMLDDLADRLETLGLVKEAEGVDVFANTIEAAGAYTPQTVYPAGHPSRRMPSPNVGTPGPSDVVMEYRDKAQTNIDSIKTALQQFGALLESIAKRMPKLQKSVDKYKQVVSGMESDIEAKLKDFLLYLKTELGGKEESMSHSIDYTRLAGEKRG